MAECGSWLLQDAPLTFSEFVKILKELEMPDFEPFYVNAYSLGKWTQENIEKLTGFSIKLNPLNSYVGLDKDAEIDDLLNFVDDLLKIEETKDVEVKHMSLDRLFENDTSDVFKLWKVKNMSQNVDLLQIGDFKILINNDCSYVPFRFLENLDVLILNSFSLSALNWLNSALESGVARSNIGLLFNNALAILQQKKLTFSTDKEQPEDKLLVSEYCVLQKLFSNLSQNNISVQSTILSEKFKPILLYHKIGFGSLKLYPLSPFVESKEYKEFEKSFSVESLFFKNNLTSSSFILNWESFNTNKKSQRFFFTGLASQTSIFEGINRMKKFGVFDEAINKNLQGETTEKSAVNQITARKRGTSSVSNLHSSTKHQPRKPLEVSKDLTSQKPTNKTSSRTVDTFQKEVFSQKTKPPLKIKTAPAKSSQTTPNEQKEENISKTATSDNYNKKSNLLSKTAKSPAAKATKEFREKKALNESTRATKLSTDASKTKKNSISKKEDIVTDKKPQINLSEKKDFEKSFSRPREPSSVKTTKEPSESENQGKKNVLSLTETSKKPDDTTKRSSASNRTVSEVSRAKTPKSNEKRVKEIKKDAVADKLEAKKSTETKVALEKKESTPKSKTKQKLADEKKVKLIEKEGKSQFSKEKFDKLDTGKIEKTVDDNTSTNNEDIINGEREVSEKTETCVEINVEKEKDTDIEKEKRGGFAFEDASSDDARLSEKIEDSLECDVLETKIDETNDASIPHETDKKQELENQADDLVISSDFKENITEKTEKILDRGDFTVNQSENMEHEKIGTVEDVLVASTEGDFENVSSNQDAMIKSGISMTESADSAPHDNLYTQIDDEVTGSPLQDSIEGNLDDAFDNVSNKLQELVSVEDKNFSDLPKSEKHPACDDNIISKNNEGLSMSNIDVVANKENGMKESNSNEFENDEIIEKQVLEPLEKELSPRNIDETTTAVEFPEVKPHDEIVVTEKEEDIESPLDAPSVPNVVNEASFEVKSTTEKNLTCDEHNVETNEKKFFELNNSIDGQQEFLQSEKITQDENIELNSDLLKRELSEADTSSIRSVVGSELDMKKLDMNEENNDNIEVPQEGVSKSEIAVDEVDVSLQTQVNPDTTQVVNDNNLFGSEASNKIPAFNATETMNDDWLAGVGNHVKQDFAQICGDVADHFDKLKMHRDAAQKEFSETNPNNIFYNNNMIFNNDEFSAEDQDELETIAEHPEIEEEEARLMETGFHHSKNEQSPLKAEAPESTISQANVQETTLDDAKTDLLNHPNDSELLIQGLEKVEDKQSDLLKEKAIIADLSPADAPVQPSSVDDIVAAWGEPMKLPSPEKPKKLISKKDNQTISQTLPINSTKTDPKRAASVKKSNEVQVGNRNGFDKSTKIRASSVSDKKSESSGSHRIPSLIQPLHTDVAFISEKGNDTVYTLDFFKKVRSACYIVGAKSAKKLIDQLLTAKQNWDPRNEPDVTQIVIDGDDDDETKKSREEWLKNKEQLLQKLKVQVYSMDQSFNIIQDLQICTL